MKTMPFPAALYRTSVVGRELSLARREIGQGRFQRSMALIAAFAAIVNGYESYSQHQRGAFSRWEMWTPVWLSLPMALTSMLALFSQRAARLLLPPISLLVLIDGAIGFVLHLRGVARMPGGYSLGRYNLVMGPPVFAPLLMCMVGILGLLAGSLRREVPRLPRWYALSARRAWREPALARYWRAADALARAVSRGRFQQGMALASGLLALLAGGEVYLEHLRGSFNQRLMWTPVWVTPPMAIAAVGAVRSERIARRFLPYLSIVTFLEGILGFFLHLRGIRRMPGGLANLQFNAVLGPPLFAPLVFTSVGLMGFLATLLRRR